MDDYLSELVKFAEEIGKNIGTKWDFYQTHSQAKNYATITPDLTKYSAEVKVEKDGKNVKWLFKEKRVKDFIPTTRGECLKRVEKDITNSQTYQSIMIQKELQKMNSNFEKLLTLFSDGVELSPNNPEKMKERSEHFSGLVDEQKE
ncbi:hypothetical protein PMV_328 [Port-miou virus]|uniref:DUF5858 domain-containing protein n=1 Tax=Port-miou virus TaxID=1733873 RepID=A0A0N9PME9_9VIRU|nr:hypothetical protein PMV_328 [Port-miou virus]